MSDLGDSSPQNEDSTGQSAGQKTYKRLELPTYDQMMSEDFMNNCFVKSVMSGVMGSLFGVAFGLFTASMDAGGGGFEAVPIEPQKPTRVVVKEILLNMKNKSLSYAKGFGIMGAVYSSAECLVEKHRAKHDKWNAMYAGCATGGIMAYSAGPKAMCAGCATFAAFSLAIDHFMDLS